MHAQSVAEVAALTFVAANMGHCSHAVCKDWPTDGLKVDLPQLLAEPPTQ